MKNDNIDKDDNNNGRIFITNAYVSDVLQDVNFDIQNNQYIIESFSKALFKNYETILSIILKNYV